LSETKKGKKPSQVVSALPKDVKDGLVKLQTDIANVLKQLEKVAPTPEKLRQSSDQVRSEFQKRLGELRSLIDKYIAKANLGPEMKADLEKARKELPELGNKLEESITKQATSIYTTRVKVFVNDLSSALKRLRSKIGY
jgi:chromosome segregation ATPase